MRWRVSEHGIFAGTLRIARFDFDTDPSQEYREELYAEMEAKLNRGTVDEANTVLVNRQTYEDIQALAEENSDGGESPRNDAVRTGEGPEEPEEGPEVGREGKEHVAGDGPYLDYH